jgi:membrane associated rhomboid family serine protease
VFTNALIEEAKNFAVYAGIGGALGGILVGWLLGRARKRVMPN